MFEAEKIINLNNDWITFVFFIILSILTTEKFLFGNRLVQTSTFFIKKNNLLSQFNREKNTFFNLFQILFYIVDVLTIALLIYFLIENLDIQMMLFGFELYIGIAIGTALYFLFRFLIGAFLAYSLELGAIHNKITFYKINYLNNTVIWILPFVLLVAYYNYHTSIVINTTLIIFCILLIFRYVFLIINNKNLIINNLFYFILYLCVLEIAPLVIILKLTI